VEPARWCGGANLDYRLVRSDNGRSGDHFWLSLAQLIDIGEPLISGKRLQSCHPNRELFCVQWKRYRPLRKLFVRLNPLAAGLLKKMRPGAIN
jgi:hypothetical protein